ncbi:MAG: DUF349 domain-containing protein [Erysipelotrichaceae bacterium]|nr:DUF349 domain-containing protein [Erysipelotrichaceae bacterium]
MVDRRMTKEELLEQAKQLAENPDSADAVVQARVLRKKWGRVKEEEESLYDKELQESFNAYLDVISAKESEAFGTIEDRKRAIIDKAKEVLNQTNFKKASEAMNDLMEQWKVSGRINKEKDDELWNEFKEVRNTFFDNRNEYYQKLQESYEHNKEVKKELIEKAKEANTLDNFKEIANRMDALMEEWKKTGRAGKEDDDLWKQFSAERKTFFNNRNAYYSGLKETFAKKTTAKQEIIEKAKKNLAISSFSDEEFEEMKDLRRQWKEIGNAGRENENTLWDAFNKVMTTYFDNAKYYRN